MRARLFDDIGPRLTGSPNLAKANAWTRDQLAAMGCVNAHLESWGDFGMGWRQISTSVDMVTPGYGGLYCPGHAMVARYPRIGNR